MRIKSQTASRLVLEHVVLRNVIGLLITLILCVFFLYVDQTYPRAGLRCIRHASESYRKEDLDGVNPEFLAAEDTDCVLETLDESSGSYFPKIVEHSFEIRGVEVRDVTGADINPDLRMDDRETKKNTASERKRLRLSKKHYYEVRLDGSGTNEDYLFLRYEDEKTAQETALHIREFLKETAKQDGRKLSFTLANDNSFWAEVMCGICLLVALYFMYCPTREVTDFDVMEGTFSMSRKNLLGMRRFFFYSSLGRVWTVDEEIVEKIGRAVSRFDLSSKRSQFYRLCIILKSSRPPDVQDEAIEVVPQESPRGGQSDGNQTVVIPIPTGGTGGARASEGVVVGRDAAGTAAPHDASEVEPLFPDRSNEREVRLRLRMGLCVDTQQENAPFVRAIRSVLEEYASHEWRGRNDDASCCVCMSSPPCVAFLPCRHVNACRQCAVGLAECPVCRTRITERHVLFF
eukprot:Rmarinus@m.13312